MEPNNLKPLEILSKEEKEEIYRTFKEEESLIDGYPLLRLVDKETFFGDNKPKKISCWKQLYHTFF